MKTLMILSSLVVLSACSVGKKCTYTQDGTKISSYVWFYKDKPIDLDKMNCNQKGNMNKIIDKFMLWQLMYRREIVIFVSGFIIGAIIL